MDHKPTTRSSFVAEASASPRPFRLLLLRGASLCVPVASFAPVASSSRSSAIPQDEASNSSNSTLSEKALLLNANSKADAPVAICSSIIWFKR